MASLRLIVTDTFPERPEFLPDVIIEGGLLLDVGCAHIHVELLLLITIRCVDRVDVYYPIHIRRFLDSS